MSANATVARWEARRLRDAVTKLVDGSHNPPPKQGDGRPMLSARNVDNGQINFGEYRLISNDAFATEHARTRVAPGDVLLTIVGTIGRSAVVPEGHEPFALQRSVAVLTANDDLLPKFLAYQLQSPKVQRHFESHARGTAQKGVYLKTLGETPILVPPVSVQTNIIAEIEKQFSRLDEAVANLKRVKANLKRYKAAMLKAAVEGRLVPSEAELAKREGRAYETGTELLERILDTRRSKRNGTGDYTHPDWTETVRPPQLPEGWSTCGIAQIVSAGRDALKTGPFGTLLKKHEHRSSGVPVLGIENICSMRFIRKTKISITFEKARQLNDYAAQPGDVLVSRSGTVGEVCVVPNDHGEARISTNLLRVRLASNGMLPEFLVLLFNGSPFVLDQVAQLCKGSTRDFLNQGILKRLSFVVPPLAEQHRIVAEVDRRLSIVREVESEVDANLKRAQALRQAVLARAFAPPGATCAGQSEHAAATA